jgi:hypothetical protein
MPSQEIKAAVFIADAATTVAGGINKAGQPGAPRTAAAAKQTIGCSIIGGIMG